MPLGPELAGAIRSHPVPLGGNPFEELFASVRWEEVGAGRRGAVLVRPDEAGGVPLVRTTTRYGAPARCFGPVHERLAQQVRASAAVPIGFNNALIETYTSAYTTMSGHSDLALDLADGSFIAVFSCYQRPEHPPRTLLVEPKEPGGAGAAVPLAHNSAVVFSVEANRRFRHKIVLRAPDRAADHAWLGVTFRTSKTVVQFRDERVRFSDGTCLTLADEEQRHEFYRLRRRENAETDFTYPRITYTVSASDLMPPDRE